jgi:hypothetical protein
MFSSTTTLPVPVAPPDVLAFAAEQGVTEYLPAVSAMTRRIFPIAPMKVFLEEDPEIANDRHIVLKVPVARDTSVEDLVAFHRQWSSEIFQHCPATHVCVFSLGVTPSA